MKRFWNFRLSITMLLLLMIGSGAAIAAKGDLIVRVPKSAPLLQGKTLDLRFAKFAQGIWVSDIENCPVAKIHAGPPGSTLAIYRGLLETPNRICQVYGAELDVDSTQRAAINCLLNDGGEAIELVTVQLSGENSLMLQFGEFRPTQYKFCERILPAIQPSTEGK